MSRRRRSSICGNAMKGAARRVEKESSAYPTIEGTGALQRWYPR